MPGAILYIRVSTPEQADQVHNLPTQTRKVEDRCKRDGLPVLKTFIDAESARTADRPQFQAMLDYCRKHRGKVTHVVFADLSRLARNVADQGSTLATFKHLGITPVSCDERIEDSAAGKMSVNMLGIVNQFCSDNLSERTRYRMSVGVQEGRWLHLAPIGYLNGTNGTSGLQVDSQRATLVRQAFEWVATRSYSLEEILRRLRLLGLTTRRAGRLINRQTLSRMLRNQIYAGWIVSGENKIKGQHEALVRAGADAARQACHLFGGKVRAGGSYAISGQLLGRQKGEGQSISPGGVYNGQPEDFVARLTNLIPLGRMAAINEYQGAIVFLCSDASSYMTGTNLVVDGGRSCW